MSSSNRWPTTRTFNNNNKRVDSTQACLCKEGCHHSINLQPRHLGCLTLRGTGEICQGRSGFVYGFLSLLAPACPDFVLVIDTRCAAPIDQSWPRFSCCSPHSAFRSTSFSILFFFFLLISRLRAEILTNLLGRLTLFPFPPLPLLSTFVG
jgi:hypothetical protein